MQGKKAKGGTTFFPYRPTMAVGLFFPYVQYDTSLLLNLALAGPRLNVPIATNPHIWPGANQRKEKAEFFLLF